MKNLIWSILILILLFACKGNKSEQVKKGFDSAEIKIPTTTSSELGIDSLLLNNLTNKIEKQEYPNIHSLLIAKNGKLFFEYYSKGKDQIWGRDIGTIQFTDSTLHDIRSVTKSVVSACVGIAIEKGYIKGVNQKISDFFPEMDSILVDDKSKWTIQDFLTMTTGLSWNEDVPYNNPENDEIQMTSSKNPIKFVLSRTLETEPGAKFNYSGGATQVLAEIIVRSSNTQLDKFVGEHLFAPLGIETFEPTQLLIAETLPTFKKSCKHSKILHIFGVSNVKDMILSFGSKETEQIWNGNRVKKMPIEIQNAGRRKLRMLNNSQDLEDLRIPPSNRLEKLTGKLSGYYSIRINKQWRIVFIWDKGNASEVEIIDYH